MPKPVDDYIEPLLDAQKSVKQIEKAILHGEHVRSLEEIRKAQIALEKIQKWLVKRVS